MVLAVFCVSLSIPMALRAYAPQSGLPPGLALGLGWPDTGVTSPFDAAAARPLVASLVWKTTAPWVKLFSFSAGEAR